jgi:hypothetical protein
VCASQGSPSVASEASLPLTVHTALLIANHGPHLPSKPGHFSRAVRITDYCGCSCRLWRGGGPLSALPTRVTPSAVRICFWFALGCGSFVAVYRIIAFLPRSAFLLHAAQPSTLTCRDAK